MEWLETTDAVVAIISGIVACICAWNAWRKPQSQPRFGDSEVESIPERFFALFEAHGVHRNQIPSFFGKGLTLTDVSSPETLLSKLSPELLVEAAELFAINLEWLQGAIKTPYPTHHFYKQPDDFINFIDELANGGNPLCGYVFNTKPLQNSLNDYDAAIVITEEIGQVNDRPVFRIHICNGWVFNYWKCRGYLAACIAIAWRNGVHLIGKQVDSDWLIKFECGDKLIGYDYDNGHLQFPVQATWYADELVERPEKYLKWIDPESSQFGLKAALQLWLMLDEQGYMQMYSDGSHTSVNAAFNRALTAI
ncbi:hypothetical protein Q4488_10725 [Amphritea sp. 1_MG-2023]|uniref:hypothetical protein n=1 Tax=Amphritea sp. 1_MG-2023 TaxID=3062670 RepID=UPI0026E1BFAE|nr:hypothetical protein [Amphritea sp. 1_MG-2023]MDO6563855.1 hypothetical protein [Amphritea sp. 1_MG-2023]